MQPLRSILRPDSKSTQYSVQNMPYLLFNNLIRSGGTVYLAFTTFDLFIFSQRKLFHGKDVGRKY